MKIQFKVLSISILMITAVALTAFNFQDKEKNNKQEQKQDKGKNQDKGNRGNKGGNSGNNNNGQQGGKKDEKMNKGNNDANDNRGRRNENGNGNNDKNHDNDNNGKDGNVNGGRNVKWDDEKGYDWDRESFKERRKLRNSEKVTICHKFKNDNEPAVALRISANALDAHMAHGDVRGDCPTVQDTRFSDIFLRKRTDYYNNIYETQEQVVYSRSILGYALERLANSRLQLATMRNNNMPLADIERKQATVVELEQNVSLLETLLGVVANLVVNKLQQ